MLDWKSINVDKCCINGIYEGFSGIQYFNEVRDGVVQHPEKGLFAAIKDMALEEMQKWYPQATEAWAYLNFLLKSSVCYVEYLDMHGRKNKMCLCANINILKACTEYKDGQLTFKLSDPNSLRKFSAVDVNAKVNYSVTGLKINKKLYTSLKLPIFLKGTQIHIAPICLLTETLRDVLRRDGITRYEYMKDNGDTRTLDTTLDRTVLIKHYTSERADEMLNSTSASLDTLFNKGYIRVVELGASKYDSGVRALNLAKINTYKQIEDSDVDYRFIDVDFGGLQDTFHYYMERIVSPEVLLKYVKDFIPEINSDNLAYLRQELFAKVDTNITYGSTQYLRFLYLYMLDHPEVFGEAIKPIFNIDMGISQSTGQSTEEAGAVVDLGISTSDESEDIGDLGVSSTNDWGSIARGSSAHEVNEDFDWDSINTDNFDFGISDDNIEAIEAEVAFGLEFEDIDKAESDDMVDSVADMVDSAIANNDSAAAADDADDILTKTFKFE